MHKEGTGRLLRPNTAVTAEDGYIRVLASSSCLISCDGYSLHLGVRKAQTVRCVLAVGNQSVCRVASCSIMHHTASPDQFSSRGARS
jgi:hypothetical protein